MEDTIYHVCHSRKASAGDNLNLVTPRLKGVIRRIVSVLSGFVTNHAFFGTSDFQHIKTPQQLAHAHTCSPPTLYTRPEDQNFLHRILPNAIAVVPRPRSSPPDTRCWNFSRAAEVSAHPSQPGNPQVHQYSTSGFQTDATLP